MPSPATSQIKYFQIILVRQIIHQKLNQPGSLFVISIRIKHLIERTVKPYFIPIFHCATICLGSSLFVAVESTKITYLMQTLLLYYQSFYLLIVNTVKL